MKFCQSHWEDLRAKIRERGLYGLVATSGEQAMSQMVKSLEGAAPKSTFDPLMSLHWMIVNRAMSVAGLELMMVNEDGSERCPLCYLIANCPCGQGEACPIRKWPDGAADAVREEAIKLGLMASDAAPATEPGGEGKP